MTSGCVSVVSVHVCVHGGLFCVDMCVSPEVCRSYLLRVCCREGHVCLRSVAVPIWCVFLSVLVMAA